MNTLKLSDNFSMPAIDYAGQGNAILGIRDAGKTYTAMKIAEELMDSNIPIIVYDPVGVWKNLKIGTGRHKGYPIVTAGGEESDIKLTIYNASDIVRAAMKENVSLVIDLYAPELINKSTWIKIVQETVDLLMYENKTNGMRHIFLEESAEFIPQRLQPQHARVYASIERLARMGRNARLGYTIINQRAEEVNKAILEISSLSLLHKQVGKNSLSSIQKWLDLLQLDNTKEIIKSLPGLSQGQCWAVGATKNPQLIQVLPRKTFHPDPKKSTETIDAAKKKVDVTAWVEKLNKLLIKPVLKVAPNVSKNDKSVSKNQPSVSEANQIERLMNENGQLKKSSLEKDKHISTLNNNIKMYDALLKSVVSIIEKNTPALLIPDFKTVPLPHPPVRNTSGLTQIVYDKVKENKKVNSGQVNGSLPVSELKILTAVAQYPNGLTRQQISGLCNLKRSSRDAYIARLKTKNLIDNNCDRIIPSEDGMGYLGDDFEPLPTGTELQEYWQKHLPASEWEILQQAINSYPNTIARQQLSSEIELKRSSRDAYIARLKTKELITTPAAGEIKAAEILFN